MLDLYDAQAWAENHDQYSQWVAKAYGSVRARLRTAVSLLPNLPGQLLAGLFALGLTLMTFAGSAA